MPYTTATSHVGIAGALRNPGRVRAKHARPQCTPSPGEAIIAPLWGRSSAGRAPRSQCGGREFDPHRLHQNSRPPVLCGGLVFCGRPICGGISTFAPVEGDGFCAIDHCNALRPQGGRSRLPTRTAGPPVPRMAKSLRRKRAQCRTIGVAIQSSRRSNRRKAKSGSMQRAPGWLLPSALAIALAHGQSSRRIAALLRAARAPEPGVTGSASRESRPCR